MASKICSRCKKDKNYSEFAICRSAKDGLQFKCRTCQSYLKKKNYYENKEREIQKSRDYRATNPDAGRESKLKTKYGIDSAKYESILIKQEGKCAICKNSTQGRLHVDHSHKSGNIRGLLCFNCNASLGKFGDSIEILKSALEYLQKFGE